MNIFTQYIISQTGNKYLAQEQLHQLENNIFANICLYYPHPEIQRLLRIKVWSCSILAIWPFFLSSLILVVATGYPNNSRNSISVTSSSSFSNVIIEYIYSNSLGLQCIPVPDYSSQKTECSEHLEISQTSTGFLFLPSIADHLCRCPVHITTTIIN